MDITGKIKAIMDEEKFDSGFYKREFVITTEEQYPNDIKFELLKEKSELIKDFKEGDRLKVLFDIRGREWNGKYFNNLVAWKLEAAGQSAGPDGPPETPPMPSTEPVDLNSEDEDDLPF